MPTYLHENILGAKRLGRKCYWGETTRVCGAKPLGLKIEAKRLGGNDQGGKRLGAKRLVTIGMTNRT